MTHRECTRIRSLVPALALLAAAPPLSAPLRAQAAVPGIDVNVAGETKRDRAPLTFGGAYVAPAGARGVSIQQAVMTRRDSQLLFAGPGRVYRHQFASTVSAYWGVSERLTVGGSMGFTTTRAEYSWHTTTPGAPPTPSYRSSAGFSPFNFGAFARARLYASADGATQVAANLTGSVTQGHYDADIPGYGLGAGLALAQRAGPLVLHLAPSARIAQGRYPYAEVAGAILVPILPRVTGSFETLYSAGGQRLGLGTSGTGALEMGGGFRFDLGRVKLDLGVRGTTAVGTPDDAPSRIRAMLGTHIKF